MSEEPDTQGAWIRRWRSLRLMVGTAFRASPRHAVLYFGSAVAQSVATLGFAYALKILIDAGAGRDLGRGVGAAAAIAVLGGCISLSSVLGAMVQVRLAEATGFLLDQRLMTMTAGVAGLEHHERPDYLNEITLLREQRQRLAYGIGAISQTLGVAVQAVGTLGLLASIHPALLLLPLSGIPGFFAEQRSETLRRDADNLAAEKRRRVANYFELGTTPGPAKEIRIFGLGDEFFRRRADLTEENRRLMVGAFAKATALAFGGSVVFGLGFAAALWLVVDRALRGELAPGDVVLAFTLGAQVNVQVGTTVGAFQWFVQTLDTARRYLWLIDYAAASQARLAGDRPAPATIADGIEFEGVHFTYPGTTEPVLADVNLRIPAGSVVAVVGDNGAGKSTLVKLLARFYEPTAGRVLVDGIPLSRISPEEWRSVCSAGFQDFAKFELLAREAVGVGALTDIDDSSAVADALQRAGGGELPGSWTAGLETQLGVTFDGGVELSGGQWQKVALGRAMMRTAPLVLVLDEPTSALDAETEHALFERYAAATRRTAAGVGGVTVVVSHRFSTVRMADVIVVVDGGRIVEAGSHHELMSNGGLYAELYELQASSYR
ncbi:MAG: ABC transporter ATP-binding protein [Actinobacteria bacterium]|nr:ABC transporter ATP-binding protein [Actinomycetota bacterium]